MRRRGGFTLIELLIVIIILGLLAVLAQPFLWKTKDRALISAMAQDLRVLATQQELYFSKNLQYANDPLLVGDFHPSAGILITITYAQTDGWAATAQHSGVPGTCGIFTGNALPSAAPPATQPGVATCN